MRRRFTLPALVLAAALQTACEGPGQATAPGGAAAPRAARAAAAAGGLAERVVTMMDACDPQTFNAALGDPTACLRKGGVTFDHFLAQLTRHGDIGAWRFASSTVNAKVGETIVAVNRGGEVHTFTEVARFAGGVVPVLNQLTGETEVAPECLALTGADFVPAGGSARVTVDAEGTELYECCIHPWMRATVHVRAH